MVYKRKSKEFVCPHCRRDFNKESSLKKHISDSHKVLQVNPQHSPIMNHNLQSQEEKGWR